MDCSGDAMSKLGSPKAKVLVIMILVFLMTYLLVFLAIFGTWRRRSRSLFWKVMLWTSYTTSAVLVPYILGLIQEAAFHFDLFFLWGMLLLIVYAFPDSFSAYSPDDVTQWKLHYIQFLVKFYGLVILWLGSLHSNVGSHFDFKVMCLFTSVVFIKVVKRSMAQIFASPSSIEERAKISELYMRQEFKLWNKSDANPHSMKGYNYLVARAGSRSLTLEDVLGPLQENQQKIQSNDYIVTLEKVWSCEGALLKQDKDRGNRLRDICLSYSLLKILHLKCAGCVLPTEVLSKESKLILEGLLNSSSHGAISQKEIDRAFRVIEVELKLLYELIYTKYPLFSVAIFAGIRLIEFILSLVVCGLSAVYLTKNANSPWRDVVAEVWGLNLDVLGTYILLGMIVFADIAQMVMIFSSEWVKASLIFNYVAKFRFLNNSLVEKLITRVCIPRFWKPWARELGQYSLIQSCCYGSETWISTMASAIYPDKNWDWQTEGKAIRLSNDVKGAVLDCLRAIEINPNERTNFLMILKEYKNLEWACNGRHEAEVILVWHVATSYYQDLSLSSHSRKDMKVATDLSNYLAYLVFFAPRLLPGPPFDPQYHARRLMKESREKFKDCKKAKDKIRELKGIVEEDNQHDEGIIFRGARLGKQLLQLGENESKDVWQILARFWSEMTLCAATSGEVRAHLEKLANGGEFITHLWALLHHAGASPTRVVSEVKLPDGLTGQDVRRQT